MEYLSLQRAQCRPLTIGKLSNYECRQSGLFCHLLAIDKRRLSDVLSELVILAILATLPKNHASKNFGLGNGIIIIHWRLFAINA